MNNFGPPDGFKCMFNSAQIARATARSLAATQSARGPYILRILVLVAWHYPKELDSRAAPLTRKQIWAMLKAIGMGMSKVSVRKVLEKLVLAKLVELEGSKVRASDELLADLATLEAASVGNVPVSIGQSAEKENAIAKLGSTDSATKRSESELQDLETLIRALKEFLLTGIAKVSTDVMAASKEPMRQFLDAVATVASRAAKGETIEDLTAEIRRAITAAPISRVSSTTFAVVYRQKKARERVEAEARAKTEYEIALFRAQLGHSERLSSVGKTQLSAESGADPEAQTVANSDPAEDQTDGNAHHMFIAPIPSPDV